jgi:hypothetical protein
MAETKEAQSSWLKREIMIYLKYHSPEELKKLIEWCIKNKAEWEKQQEKEVMKLMEEHASKNNE